MVDTSIAVDRLTGQFTHVSLFHRVPCVYFTSSCALRSLWFPVCTVLNWFNYVPWVHFVSLCALHSLSFSVCLVFTLFHRMHKVQLCTAFNFFFFFHCCECRVHRAVCINPTGLAVPLCRSLQVTGPSLAKQTSTLNHESVELWIDCTKKMEGSPPN